MFSKHIELQTRWGDGNRHPSIVDLKNAVNELKQKDDEHPCAFISDEFGDVVEAYQDGRVVYYSLDTPDKRHETKVDEIEKVLDIWLLFCEGKQNELDQLFKRN